MTEPSAREREEAPSVVSAYVDGRSEDVLAPPRCDGGGVFLCREHGAYCGVETPCPGCPACEEVDRDAR